MQEPKFRTVNQILGAQPNLGPFPASQIVPWGLILIFCWFCKGLLNLNWLWTGLLAAWLMSTCWILFGDKSGATYQSLKAFRTLFVDIHSTNLYSILLMEKRIKTTSGEAVFFYSILPQTRTGKSVLVSSILAQALSKEMPIVEFDSPETGSTATFFDYTELIAEQGAYFNISKQNHNLLEVPDFRTLPHTVL